MEETSSEHQYPKKSQAYSTVAVLILANVMSLIDRHKLIYLIFSKELTKEIHALQIKAYTPSEWIRKNNNNTVNNS